MFWNSSRISSLVGRWSNLTKPLLMLVVSASDHLVGMEVLEEIWEFVSCDSEKSQWAVWSLLDICSSSAVPMGPLVCRYLTLSRTRLTIFGLVVKGCRVRLSVIRLLMQGSVMAVFEEVSSEKRRSIVFFSSMLRAHEQMELTDPVGDCGYTSFTFFSIFAGLLGLMLR